MPKLFKIELKLVREGRSRETRPDLHGPLCEDGDDVRFSGPGSRVVRALPSGGRSEAITFFFPWPLRLREEHPSAEPMLL